MNFGYKINEYKDDIMKDLKTLIEIESVSSAKDTSNCVKALEFILKRAEEMGFNTKNIDNKAGHVQLGNGGAICGVLAHLDVVPAGENWSYPPFTLTEDKGRLFGRGIADDKGAALMNLYCLKALKDSGIVGKNTLRCIFGTDEEVGMSDMEAYFNSEPVPDYSFTPDNGYGVCYAEKGILQVEIFMDRNDGKILSAIKAGNAMNAVPDYAEALIYSSEAEAENIIHKRKNFEGNFEFRETIDGLVITSKGKASHACEPEKGTNAVVYLAKLLGEFYNSEELGTLCTFINTSIGTEIDGTNLGIKCHDSVSKDLTCTLSKVRINDNRASVVLDIRYPVTINGERIFNHIKNCAGRKSLDARIVHHSLPLYLPKESKIVNLLSGAYEDVMGNAPKLYSTGGGTYARVLGGKGVGFGPCFEDDNVNMHNADESIDKEKYFKHGEICLQAMYKMFTESFD
jgi:succinyl-diaminopimelate desuccinylase